ncbi:right-handed parallel beta-helix repeat-containing protein [Thiolapillus sp.]
MMKNLPRPKMDTGKYALSTLALVAAASAPIASAESFRLNPPCVAGSGTDYPVGPGQAYTSISDVPWGSLEPGDTVRIHHKPAPYREKIIIRTSGTTQNPLRICGVKGSNGERPILDGDGATNDPDDAAAYTSYAPMEGLAMIMIYNRDYGLKDSNIIIDGLHIRNAKNTFSYTRVNGSSDTYENGAACIRIQAGDNIIIRDNEIENCGNGIFTMSQGYNEAHLTRNLLIEGNYIHQNGQADSYREHGLYIQAIGATYQYNRFGSNAAGAGGTTLKERVAGSVVRYNWFEGSSSRFLDLVEVEDAAPWYIVREYLNELGCTDSNNCPGIDPDRLQKVQEAEAMYRKTHVYGNFFNHIGSQTDAGSMVHYGWDNDIALAREGSLYFYHNTVSIQEDLNDSWRFRLFDMRNNYGGTPKSRETIEAFNNIIYYRNETSGEAPAYLCMSNSGGTINFGTNWISNFNQSETLANCYYDDPANAPTLNGLGNLLDGTNAPAPVDSFLQTLDTPLVIGKAQAMPPAAKPVNHEYRTHQNRNQRPSTNDLGAMEISRSHGDFIFADGFE